MQAAFPTHLPCCSPQDGAAFLLERRGDVASALRIHIRRLDAANRQLAAAVREGRLDLAAAAAQAVAAAAEGGLAGRRLLGGRQVGPAAALMRQRRPSASVGPAEAVAAAAAAALLDSGAEQPAELRAVRDALAGAVAMCLRWVLQRAAGGGWQRVQCGPVSYFNLNSARTEPHT